MCSARRRRAPLRKKRSPASFSHILAGAGFADSGILFGLVRAWQSLFLLFQPDVLLAQYAPTAQLSARLSGVPCLVLNTGFESPPVTEPFPCFRPWLNLTRDSLLETEQVLLNNCNKICKRLSAPVYSNLQQALKGDISLLAAFPEFDHYQGRTGGRFIGPLFITGDGVDIPWPEGGNSRVFVYLRPGAGTLSVLEKLLCHGASVIAFLPGSDEAVKSSLSHERLRISSDKVKLSPLLPDMKLSVTLANHGTLSALFLAGVPMLMIPTTIEQWMLSSTVERLGIGIGVTRNRLNTEFGPALENLCADTAYRSAAARFAKKYAGYDQGRVLDRLAATIEGLPVWVRNEQGNNVSGNLWKRERKHVS